MHDKSKHLALMFQQMCCVVSYAPLKWFCVCHLLFRCGVWCFIRVFLLRTNFNSISKLLHIYENGQRNKCDFLAFHFAFMVFCGKCTHNLFLHLILIIIWKSDKYTLAQQHPQHSQPKRFGKKKQIFNTNIQMKTH